MVLVLLSGLLLIASPGALDMNYANAKYAPADSQTQANANDCDNGSNCAITSPQTQGDGTANSPTNLQISGFNEEQEHGDGSDGVGVGEIGVGILRFNVNVKCPAGFACPSPQDFQYGVTARAQFGGSVTAIPSQFSGSDSSLVLLILNHLLDPREITSIFFFIDQTAPPTPPGLALRPIVTGDCFGNLGPSDLIVSGEFRDLDLRTFRAHSCTITNEYLLKAEVLVNKKVICPTGFVCPTADKFEMRLVVNGGKPEPTKFPGSESGTKVTIGIIGDVARYEVTETFPPPVGLNLIATRDLGCGGEIRPQESKTCTFTNEYRVAPTTP